MLTIASVLSILFLTFHVTDGVVRRTELSNLIGEPITVVWPYGTYGRYGCTHNPTPSTPWDVAADRWLLLRTSPPQKIIELLPGQTRTESSSVPELAISEAIR